MDRIYKRVKAFLKSFNMSSLDNVETAALAEFEDLHWRVDQGEWIISNPIWVKIPLVREEGKKNLDGGGCQSQVQNK